MLATWQQFLSLIQKEQQEDMGVTNNICASIKRFVVSVILVLIMCPVLELDSGIRASRNRARDGSDLVALVTRYNLCHIAHNLFCELALGRWV